MGFGWQKKTLYFLVIVDLVAIRPSFVTVWKRSSRIIESSVNRRRDLPRFNMKRFPNYEKNTNYGTSSTCDTGTPSGLMCDVARYAQIMNKHSNSKQSSLSGIRKQKGGKGA